MRGLRKIAWKHQQPNSYHRNISKKLQIKFVVKENDLRSLSLISNVDKSKRQIVLQKFILFPGNYKYEERGPYT